MRSEKELEMVAEAVYWHMERGEIRSAVRKLQEVQKEALELAVVKIHDRKDQKILKDEIAKLPC